MYFILCIKNIIWRPVHQINKAIHSSEEVKNTFELEFASRWYFK